MASPLDELVQFLQLGARLDLKAIAAEHVLGNTENKVKFLHFNASFQV